MPTFLRYFHVDIYFSHLLNIRHFSETSDHLQGIGEPDPGNAPGALRVDVPLQHPDKHVLQCQLFLSEMANIFLAVFYLSLFHPPSVNKRTKVDREQNDISSQHGDNVIA